MSWGWIPGVPSYEETPGGKVGTSFLHLFSFIDDVPTYRSIPISTALCCLYHRGNPKNLPPSAYVITPFCQCHLYVAATPSGLDSLTCRVLSRQPCPRVQTCKPMLMGRDPNARALHSYALLHNLTQSSVDMYIWLWLKVFLSVLVGWMERFAQALLQMFYQQRQLHLVISVSYY